MLALARVHGRQDPSYVPQGIEIPQIPANVQDELALLDEPARIPRGERATIPLRIPTEDRAVYDRLSRRAGLTTPDYMAAVMAQAHGLRIPRYLGVPSRTRLVPQTFSEAA